MSGVRVERRGKVLEITLDPAAEVRGRVLDPGGNPISNVTVAIPRSLRSGEPTLLGVRRPVVTLPDGYFRIPDAPAAPFALTLSSRVWGMRTYRDLRPEDSPFEFVFVDPAARAKAMAAATSAVSRGRTTMASVRSRCR